MTETYRITRERQRLEDMREVNVTTITAYQGDVNVGRMQWVTNTGEIVHLYVTKESRRQVIATRLWHEGQREHTVRHSRQRTRDGEAWAKSLGTPLPPLEPM
jgi:hypothetical protein